MKLKNILNPVYLFENRHLIRPTLQGRFNRYFDFIFHLVRSHGVPVTSNDRSIISLKNKHLGRRCFIIGNGPSLNIEDLNKLKNEVTFACNKIYLAFDQTSWRPTYYSILDVLVAENNKSSIDKLKLRKIFCDSVKYIFKEAKDITWLKCLGMPLTDGIYEGRFSTNALEGVYGGWTVIYPQIQLAYFMGIKEIYLIGVDYSFEISKSTGKICRSGEVLESNGEKNHFHPDYRKPGETWTTPLLDLQHIAFCAAQRTATNEGFHIYNASRRTALSVFPIVDFDHIISS